MFPFDMPENINQIKILIGSISNLIFKLSNSQEYRLEDANKFIKRLENANSIIRNLYKINEVNINVYNIKIKNIKKFFNIILILNYLINKKFIK